MSKITQGPWTVTVNDLRGGRYWTVRTSSPDHEPIDLHDDENGEANARAISAVPEMMAALEKCVEHLRCIRDGYSSLSPEDIGRAALAKARGETP